MASARLRVRESAPRDAGRGIARCDPADLERLGAEVGDILELAGKGTALARALPAYPEQRGQGLIQLDGIGRANAGLALDEEAAVRVVPAAQATSITLAPLGPGAAGLPESEHRQTVRLLEGLPVLRGHRIRASSLGTRPREFQVVDTAPGGVVIIGAQTRVRIRKEGAAGHRAGGASFEDIGGLRQEIQKIREMIELPLKHPEVFERLGIDPPRGVLLHGAPGCGKTLIARAVADEVDAYFISVSGPEIVNKLYGESEANLRQLFETATKRAPSIIFLDEIDAIVPKREDLGGEKQVEHRMVAQLLALLDGLASRGQVVVIGATNIPDSLDPALRRPGRFDREIRIGVPDQTGRREILQIHTRSMPLAGDVDLDQIARSTHGFVGADLEALAREAAMRALRRILPQLDGTVAEIPPDDLQALTVAMEDFSHAAGEIEPSALREVFVEVPDVRWDQVGGQDAAKSALQESVLWPLRYPELVRQAGARPSRGILLAGKPGTGKTLLAQAAATETAVNFIPINGPALMSRFVGESERAVREIFRKARLAAPCIVFFDEIDGLFPRRGAGGGDSLVSERVMSQFLTEFDGITRLSGVVILGATNRPELLDAALVRPGRFDVVLELTVPDARTRRDILAIHTATRPLAPDADLDLLAGPPTEGLVGADLEALASRAGWLAIRERLELGGGRPGESIEIGQRHLVAALDWLLSQKERIGTWATR